MSKELLKLKITKNTITKLEKKVDKEKENGNKKKKEKEIIFLYP